MNCFELGKVYFSELPEDLQVLICQFLEDTGCSFDDNELNLIQFQIKSLPISVFPHVPICTDDRTIGYAKAMIGQRLPPILLCKNQWLDGRHRLWALRQADALYVSCIDLQELMGFYPFFPIALLDLEQ